MDGRRAVRVGQTVAGRYRIVLPLGAGGAAEVWRVTDTRLGVDRALKVLGDRTASSPTYRRRLLAEARAMASIDHPSVLRVLDFGTCEERTYLVTELLEAGSVADRITQKGPLPPDEAVRRILEVLAGLSAVHARGIIHRDIKPQNLLIAADDRTVLADFGIALVTEGDRRTREGVSMGSFAFMPPEQRLDARSVGPPADLYAVGASLYWMLTAKNPVDLFATDATSDRFDGLQPDLVRAIRWATKAKPEERPQRADAVAALLHPHLPSAWASRPELDPANFLGPESPYETLALTPEPPPPSSFPTNRRAGRLLLVAVVLSISLSPFVWRWSTRRAPLEPEILTRISAEAPPDEDESFDREDPGLLAPIVRPGRPAPMPPPRELTPLWRGDFGGRSCTMTLQTQGDQVRGTMAVDFDGNRIDTPIRGSWSPANGELHLVDTVQAPDAGSYRLRWRGGDLHGTFTPSHRDTPIPLKLEPSAP
ncbi:MAG: serine/threonine protein kinase [Deltaproteobacteria bacterium]|nr:MAG: serine/threonine protein kinase [Deltaproteobacteria bacterium]